MKDMWRFQDDFGRPKKRRWSRLTLEAVVIMSLVTAAYAGITSIVESSRSGAVWESHSAGDHAVRKRQSAWIPIPVPANPDVPEPS